MIKSELIARIADGNHHLFNKDIERIVNVILDEIIDALARGDRVELRGFGAFTVKHRKPRTGRNPRTGEAVTVEEKFVPFFKTGRELRERLNRNGKAAGKSTAKPAAKGGGKQVGNMIKPIGKPISKPIKEPAKASVKPASPAPARAGRPRAEARPVRGSR